MTSSATRQPRTAKRAASRPESGGVLERMLDMMSIIPRAPHWISTADVDQRLRGLGYSVDRRTVVRDLNKLSARFGIERRGDCDAGEGGKRTAQAYAWRWPAQSAGIGGPVMTETEALALVMVRDRLNDMLPPMVIDALAPQIARAERKLRGIPGVGLNHWHACVRVVQPTQPLGRPRVRPAVRDAIHLALATGKRFTGWYRARGAAEAKEMLFNPLGLVIRGQVAYLVATNWEYDDPRIYPLHRFERVKQEDAPRREPPGFDLDTFLAAQNGLGFATGRGDIALRLRFYQGAGQHLLETPLSEDQSLTDLGEGTLEVAATVPETSQLTWWLLGFAGNVEVLAPAGLRAAIKESANAMAKRYR
ncbi:MAG: helix-turn-helix transcriptional regulator [Gammaproteobacteria bacterium]